MEMISHVMEYVNTLFAIVWQNLVDNRPRLDYHRNALKEVKP